MDAFSKKDIFDEKNGKILADTLQNFTNKFFDIVNIPQTKNGLDYNTWKTDWPRHSYGVFKDKDGSCKLYLSSPGIKNKMVTLIYKTLSDEKTMYLDVTSFVTITETDVVWKGADAKKFVLRENIAFDTKTVHENVV